MKSKKIKYQVAAGVILIIIGIALLLNNYIVEKRDEVFSAMNIAISEELSDNEETSTTENEATEEDNERENSSDTESSENYETYVGQLEIPKINFYKGFYAKESPLNDVKYNIKILEVSDYPTVENGNE